MMDHIKTEIHFVSKEEKWIVSYNGNTGGVSVYYNEELIHQYGSIPRQAINKAKNPTKTQATEIVKMVRKEYKQRFDREKKLKKVLNEN